MSVDTYRAAVVRLREALDVLGGYRGPCALCGWHPDARHRQADAIAGGMLAGDSVEAVADDYLTDERAAARVEKALRVAFAVVAADPRRHGLTRGRAAGVDREVWADVLTDSSTEQS